MDISLRQCVPGDEVALSLIGQATFLEAFAGVLPGSDILAHCARQHAVEKYAGWLRDLESAVWMAEVAPGNAPVGYLVLTTPDLPLPNISAGDAEIKRVYLLHRFQGLGVGGRLMKAAADYAAERGKQRLLLGVYSGNAAAIRFYEQQGFRRLGTRKFHVGANTYDDLVLGCPLGRTSGASD